jgi:predicted nucleotidyltransferase
LIDNKLKDIKRIIIEELEKENIKVHKIILFGSRARGDFKEDSDWDYC